MSAVINRKAGGCELTVDCERNFSLSHSNSRHDGLADILSCVGLAHRLQVQLVVVAEDLDQQARKRTERKGRWVCYVEKDVQEGKDDEKGKENKEIWV